MSTMSPKHTLVVERLQFLTRFAKKQPRLTRAETIADDHDAGFVARKIHFIVIVAVNADGDIEYGMIGNPYHYNPFHIHRDSPATSGAEWTPFERLTNLLKFSGFKPEELDYYVSVLKKTKEIPFYLQDIFSNGSIFRKMVAVIPVQKEKMTGMNFMHFKTIEKWSEDDKKVRAYAGSSSNIDRDSMDTLKFISEKLTAFK